MTPNEEIIEKGLQDKGKTAPRVTPQMVNDKIAKIDYHRFPGTTVTICALHLTNGYVVTGESAAASPENFDKDIGRTIAYENARSKIWGFEGYLLRERLSNEPALAQIQERDDE
jgi:hypothetical protein